MPSSKKKREEPLDILNLSSDDDDSIQILSSFNKSSSENASPSNEPKKRSRSSSPLQPVKKFQPDQDSDEEDWEEVDQSTSFGQFMLNSNQEPMEIDIPLDDGTRPRTKRLGISKVERLARIRLHVVHFLTLLASARWRNKWCDDEQVQATLLSLVPMEIQMLFQNLSWKLPENDGLNQQASNAILKACRWLHGWLEGSRVDTQKSSRQKFTPPSKAQDLIPLITSTLHHVPEEERGELTTLLTVAMLRSLQVPTRLIASLHPISVSMSLKDVKGKDTVKDPVQDGRLKKMENFLDSLSHSESDVIDLDTDDESPKIPNILYLVQVLLPSLTWSLLDLQKFSMVDDVAQHILTRSLPLKRQFGPQGEVIWPVAFQYNSIRDVASRFAPRQTVMIQKASSGLLRPPGWWQWWPTLIQRFARLPKSVKDVIAKAWEKEDEEAKKVAVDTSTKFPTRQDDFRTHPLYALEKFLRRNEIIHPKTQILGKFKSENVYSRKDVKQVYSKEHWMKQGRVIKEGEEACKIVKGQKWGKRSKGESSEGSEVELVDVNGEKVVHLFGLWQTTLYQAPPVVDGKVPKSSYGTVELFTPTMLPQGATHLPFENIGKVAKELGIDYANAVVGFEWKRGRCIPVVDGIVVPSESADLIRDAYVARTTSDQVKQAKKSKERAMNNWKRIITKAVVHYRTKERYSDVIRREESEESGGEGGFFLD